jgi:hypothetical protein
MSDIAIVTPTIVLPELRKRVANESPGDIYPPLPTNRPKRLLKTFPRVVVECMGNYFNGGTLQSPQVIRFALKHATIYDKRTSGSNFEDNLASSKDRAGVGCRAWARWRCDPVGASTDL